MAISLRGGQVLAAGHSVLADIELDIAPGEHVAIVGPSGAGKSTLIGLLLGWHRLAEGTLTVDGEALTERRQQRLRRDTAWLDPGIQLWNRPLLDNLLYARDEAGDDAATSGLAALGPVLQAARLRGVLQQLPQGLQTALGEGGARLSGGEGQRVRLGRALMQTDARLVLLDEPFRGLDRSQRSALLSEAQAWWPHATLLCVTHDVSETQGFARVLVVEDGRIVEDGAPQALAARPSRYQALLQAEHDLREQLWQGVAWRHLHVGPEAAR